MMTSSLWTNQELVKARHQKEQKTRRLQAQTKMMQKMVRTYFNFIEWEKNDPENKDLYVIVKYLTAKEMEILRSFIENQEAIKALFTKKEEPEQLFVKAADLVAFTDKASDIIGCEMDTFVEFMASVQFVSKSNNIIVQEKESSLSLGKK